MFVYSALYILILAKSLVYCRSLVNVGVEEMRKDCDHFGCNLFDTHCQNWWESLSVFWDDLLPPATHERHFGVD